MDGSDHSSSSVMQEANPSVLAQIEFQKNTTSYGRAGTKHSSSWGSKYQDKIASRHDRKKGTVTMTDEKAESEYSHYATIVDQNSADTKYANGTLSYGEPGTTDVNNVLAGHVNSMGDGYERPEYGRMRDEDLLQPSYRADHHTPNKKEMFRGGLLQAGGMAIMDPEIQQRGSAMRRGMIEDGQGRAPMNDQLDDD